MGILGDILSPIKDIINGLKKPVTEVEHIFGEVISITEDIINQLVSMVEQIEHLFDMNTFASIFIDPFKEAVLTTLNGIEKLTSFIYKYGQEGFTDIKDTLEDPVKGVYKMVKKGISDLKKEYVKLINDLSPIPGRIIDSSTRDIHSFIDRIDNDIALIQQEVKRIFRVTVSKGVDIKQDFVRFGKRGVTTLSHDINRVGTIVVDDARDLMKSMESRFKNENSALDLLIVLMIGLIIIGIVGLYVATGSTSLVVFSVIVAVVAGLTFFVG